MIHELAIDALIIDSRDTWPFRTLATNEKARGNERLMDIVKERMIDSE